MRLPSAVAFVGVAAGLPLLSTGCVRTEEVPGDVAEFSAFRDPQDAPAPLKTAARAIVRIETAAAYGTGSFISADGVLMTNNHVVGSEDCAREGCYVTLRFFHERGSKSAAKRVYMEPLRVSPGYDMAAFQTYEVGQDDVRAGKLATPDFLTFTDATNESLQGTRIHIIGHPHGHLKKWSTGDVVSADGFWFSTTAYVLPGNSGSPVLNDDGQIVGIIHRGTNDDSLVGRSAVNNESICTPAALLKGALAGGSEAEANVTTLLRSTAADVTDDDVVSHELVYRAAKVATAKVGGVDKRIYDILDARCEADLAPRPYDNLEELLASYGACRTAMAWINCSTEPPKETVCPAPEAQAKWQERFKTIYERRKAFNGEESIYWITSAPLIFEPSAEARAQKARAAYEAWLAAAKPALDFEAAATLLSYGYREYGGWDLKEYVLQYDLQPHYELSISSIIGAAQSLYFAEVIDGVQFRGLTRVLFEDPKISLGDKLYVEEVGYVQGVLP